MMEEHLEIVKSYFPQLSPLQKEQLAVLADTCRQWNDKINVISRKDIDNLEVNHILHSLAIAKFIQFTPGSTVIDLGTGGGFPGLPLAVLFPEVKFHLVDRIAKKLMVAQEMATKMGLKNVTFQHGDFSECKVKADFIVSRAVMPQADLVKLARKNIRKENVNAVPNGLISLKGGDLSAELANLRQHTEVVELSSYFSQPFFSTKKLAFTNI